MLDLGTLLIKIKADGIKDVKKSLEEIKSGASKSADGVESRFGALSGKIGTLMKGAAVAGVAALGAATLKLGKDAIKAYADYEQLSGGVQKIFGKDTAKIVEKNAKNAFKTAGISANEYMEQVTSFSASLLQSVGGDTEKAAKIADMAVKDMSDNANTFGTDIASIQNAYQGFAKQNYSMLDNLKLGYGGTKTEMERLLADAEKITGKKYDISNLNDVYEAIHVIQKETKITGTTAKEAAKTISGSVASMKASWTNLMTAIATGDSKEIEKAISDFGTSAINVLKNIIPAIGRVAIGIPKAIISAITSVNWGELWNTITNKVSAFFNSLGAKLPTLLPQLVTKVVTAIPQFIGKITDAISNFTSGAGTNKMISAAGNLVKGLATGLIKAIPILIKALPKILLAMAKLILTWVTKLQQMGVRLVKSLGKGLLSAVATALAPFVQRVGSIFNKVKATITRIITSAKNAVLKIFNSIKEGITNRATAVWNGVKKIFNGIKSAISNAVTSAKNTVLKVFSSIKEGVSTRVSSVYNTVKRIFNNIKSAISKPINTAKDAVKKAIDKIKGFFNFKVSLPKIKLPHFSISPAGWQIGDLLKGSIPSLGIRWYKEGGFFDRPTILSGLGEAGPEYALPLNQKSLAPLASMLNTLMINERSRAYEQPIIVNTDLYIDGKKVASTTAPYMRTEIQKIQTSLNRQKGIL